MSTSNEFDAVFITARFPVQEGHSYEGRNGFGKCTGMELYLPSSEVSNISGNPAGVTLTPFTSKNRLAESTRIEVSSDPKTLRELAAAFTRLADESERRLKPKKR